MNGLYDPKDDAEKRDREQQVIRQYHLYCLYAEDIGFSKMTYTNFRDYCEMHFPWLRFTGRI